MWFCCEAPEMLPYLTFHWHEGEKMTSFSVNLSFKEDSEINTCNMTYTALYNLYYF